MHHIDRTWASTLPKLQVSFALKKTRAWCVGAGSRQAASSATRDRLRLCHRFNLNCGVLSRSAIFEILLPYLWVGGAVAYIYTYRHLVRYEAELSKGVESAEDFRRTTTGFRLFALYSAACLSYVAFAGN